MTVIPAPTWQQPLSPPQAVDDGPPTVVDLGYGDLRIAAAPDSNADRARVHDVRELLDAVDAPAVRLGQATLPLRHAWHRVFADLGLPFGGASAPRPLLIGHPSSWGSVRTQVLADVAAGTGAEVILLPRAVLVARSHADPAVVRCAVVETSHVPTPPADPVRPEPARWDVSLLHRDMAGWSLQASTTIATGADDLAAAIGAAIDDGVEAVYVDGAVADVVTAAGRTVAAHVVAGRVIAVDRQLLLARGWLTGSGRDHLPPPLSLQPAPPPRRRRLATTVAGAFLALLVIIAAVISVVTQMPGAEQVAESDNRTGDEAAPPPPEQVRIGRTVVAMPRHWRRTNPDDAANDADPSTIRTVFADPEDGRRIILVQTEVLSDSTLASVAASLANRIEQRGDDVVREFSPATQFAGREVIGYRETPVSGSTISWYVLVESGLQVSVGCQPGTGEAGIDDPCQAAVGSVQIDAQ